MHTTSSHRPNLRPTSRSVPIISNPHDCVQCHRGVVVPADAGHDGVEAMSLGQAEQLVQDGPPDAQPLGPLRHVDRVLDGRAVGGPGPIGAIANRTRRRRPRPSSSVVTATTAGWAPECPVDHSSWSSSDLGLMSNVAVPDSISRL